MNIEKLKEIRRTIIQYQKKQKMLYAAQLLLNSSCRVSEIVDWLEYDSLSHFLRIFKQQYGMTPKEYRKAHMKSTEELSS